jgi:di/tricarboxylate transporter
MGELRVALPGVQVLFAFLLVVPFNQRFGKVSQFERHLYFTTPPAHALRVHAADCANHRPPAPFSARREGLRRPVFAIAMTTAVLLITHYLFSPLTAIITTIAAVAAFIVIWFLLPLRRRRSSGERNALLGASCRNNRPATVSPALLGFEENEKSPPLRFGGRRLMQLAQSTALDAKRTNAVWDGEVPPPRRPQGGMARRRRRA